MLGVVNDFILSFATYPQYSVVPCCQHDYWSCLNFIKLPIKLIKSLYTLHFCPLKGEITMVILLPPLLISLLSLAGSPGR